MEISGKLKIKGPCLYLEAENSLIIADLHLGYEEMLNRRGLLVPRTNFAEIKASLEKAFEELPLLEEIIVNGDLKHEFGLISKQEWSEVLDMLSFLQEHCRRIVLVKGNHDSILGPIAKWKGIGIAEQFFIESRKMLLVHGHKLASEAMLKKAEVIVIGHEHPALLIREGPKSERYKCFLKGKFRGRELIVLPSLSAIACGTDVLRDKPLSPFLQQELQDFGAWVLGDRPYFFSRLGSLQHL